MTRLTIVMHHTDGRTILRIFSAAVLAVTLGACRNESPTPVAAAQPPAAVTPGTVDSAISIDVALSRFRRDVAKTDRLHSNVASRDVLVREVVSALRRSDTASIERLALNLAEYAWLYYPTTAIARPPYELPPALAWFQLQEKNRKGALRALRELGGHRVDYLGYRCAPRPIIEGENRLWTRCVVTLSRDGAAPVSVRLFGAIIERRRRLEVLSYENDF
jgi:hypothetical protein